MKANCIYIYTVCALLLLIQVLSESAKGASYDIQEIHSDVSQLGAINAGSINNAGDVVYHFRVDATNPDIFKYSGGMPFMLYEAGLSPAPIWVSDGFNTPINNLGFIAFAAYLNGSDGYGLYAGNGGPLTTIAETEFADPESPFFYIDKDPDINDANMVVFTAMDKDDWTWGMYKGNGGPIVEVVLPDSTTTDQGETFYVYGIDMNPVINNEGTIAFIGKLNSHTGDENGIFKHDGSTIRAVYDSSGPFTFFYDELDMNDSGTLVFLAQTDTGPYGVYTGNGGSVTTIADDSGLMMGFSNPAINNHGQVAFMAKFDGDISREGIFVGPDPVADKILFEGESYMGGTISWLDLYRGINDYGQIVFNMMIDYGDHTTRGLYLATPAECGDDSHPYPGGDLSQDCHVNMIDMEILSTGWLSTYSMPDLVTMASNWLTCNDPTGCP